MSRTRAPIVMPFLKPRHRLAMAASRHRAGCHRATTRALRRQAQRLLQRELSAAPPPIP